MASGIGAVAGVGADAGGAISYGPGPNMQDPRSQGHRGMGFLGGFPIGAGVSQAGGNFVGSQAGGDSTMGRPGLRLRDPSGGRLSRSGDSRSRHGSMQRDDEPRSASRRTRSRITPSYDVATQTL